MSFTNTPLDGSSTPIPMSSAVPDGTNTPLALEGGPSKSTGGNTLVPVAVYQYDGYNVTQGVSTDANTVASVMGRLTKIRDLLLATLNVSLQVASSGGAVPYHNLTAASTNFTNVKAAACQLYGLDLSNTSASTIFVKLYDKASAPGTGDVPKRTIQVPANSTVMRAYPNGLQFSTGFGWAATGAVADNDNTAIAASCVVDFHLNS